MKKIAQVLFAAIVAAMMFVGQAVAAEYAPVQFTKGEQVQLDKFPIEKARLTAARQADLGLRPYKLDADAVLFDHQKDGKFVLKVLAAGTLVLVDEDGTPRYEEKCGNRLIDPAVFAPKPVAAAPQPPAASAPEKSRTDSAREWLGKQPEPLKLAAHGLGWLAALALLLGATILAFWGLNALIGTVRHNIIAKG